MRNMTARLLREEDGSTTVAAALFIAAFVILTLVGVTGRGEGGAGSAGSGSSGSGRGGRCRGCARERRCLQSRWVNRKS